MCRPVYSAADRDFCVKFFEKSLYCGSTSLQIGVEIGKPDRLLSLGEGGGEEIKQSMCGSA